MRGKVHPLVRDLYKRAIVVGRDYPHPGGLEYVRRKWKGALRDSRNCALVEAPTSPDDERANERAIRRAVGRGRHFIREMEGTIQLKKYRAMRGRYGEGADAEGEASRIGKSLREILKEE